MISKQMQRQYKIWGSVIVLFYVVCFGFLKIHDFQVWTLEPFIESLIGVFMGAGAIAVITGIILIFQSSIQAEQEKKQEVFKEKMKLYSSIIDKMTEINRDKHVSDDERLDILSIQSKIALLSNQTTFDKFIDVQSGLTTDEKKDDCKVCSDNNLHINENYTNLLMDFIGSARDDLEVQEAMTMEQKKKLEETKEKSKKVAKSFSKPFQKTFYNDFEDYLKNNPNITNVGEQRVQLLREIHNHITKDFVNIDISYSKRNLNFGIENDGQKRKTVFIVETQIKKHLRLLTLAPSSEIPEKLLNGTSSKYNVVEINDISDFLDIKKAIERSYNIIINN